MKEGATIRREYTGGAVLLVVIIGLRCGSGSQTPVIDGASVESSTPKWEEEVVWRVADLPLVEIGGGTEPAYQLFQVSGAVRLSDGTIVIANRGSAELRYYTDSGVFLNAGGRDGEGPGEFRVGYGPASAWRLPGDSVAAWDPDVRRLSVFDGRGMYGRSTTLLAPTGEFPSPVGLTEDERVVTAAYPTERRDVPLGEVYSSLVRYEVFRPSGERLVELAQLPWTELWVAEWNGLRGSFPRPFSSVPQVAVGNDALYYTSSRRFDVVRMGLDGDSIAVYRVLQEPDPLSHQVIADYRTERMRSAPGDPTGRHAWERWLAQVPYPETLPTFRSLLIDVAGNLWASRFVWPRRAPSEAWVFNLSGQWLGAVRLPMGFTPYDVGDVYVLGLWTDPDGVEYIRMYDLVKPSS